MKERWSVELTDEEWAIVYKALKASHDLPYVKGKSAEVIADKIHEKRQSLTPRGYENLCGLGRMDRRATPHKTFSQNQ